MSCVNLVIVWLPCVPLVNSISTLGHSHPVNPIEASECLHCEARVHHIIFINNYNCAYQISCNTIYMSLHDKAVLRQDDLIFNDLSSLLLSRDKVFHHFQGVACFYVRLPHTIGS
jgi:hypothetical protein